MIEQRQKIGIFVLTWSRFLQIQSHIFVIVGISQDIKSILRYLEHEINTVCLCTIFIQIEAWSSISYKWFLTWCLNESSVYSDPSIYFSLFACPDKWQVPVPVFYEFDSVVWCQHVYKSAWTPVTDKCMSASCRKTMNMSHMTNTW